jgi:hypothetical protein
MAEGSNRSGTKAPTGQLSEMYWDLCSNATRSCPRPVSPPPPAPPALASETAARPSSHPSRSCSSESRKTSPTSATHTSASRTSSRIHHEPSTSHNGSNTRCPGVPTTRQRHPPRPLLTTAPKWPRSPVRSNPSAVSPLRSTVGRSASSYRKSVPVPKKNR